MPRQTSWKSRYYRIFPILRSLGIDPDEALDFIAEIAELPAADEVARGEDGPPTDSEIASDPEELPNERFTKNHEEDRKLAPNDPIDATRSPSNTKPVDFDECPCDGCRRRRLNDARRWRGNGS